MQNNLKSRSVGLHASSCCTRAAFRGDVLRELEGLHPKRNWHMAIRPAHTPLLRRSKSVGCASGSKSRSDSTNLALGDETGSECR